MASVFAQDLKLEFDALYAEAERKRRLMVVTLHDAVARANRVKVFEDFIAYAQTTARRVVRARRRAGEMGAGKP